MTLSEKILYCRKKAMLSQEALAERIGVSRQAISKWETGEASPEIGKLLLLAQTFGVTTDWLLSEDEPEDRPEPASPPQPVPPESAHTWVDDVPGMLGTLMRKYGWLFGVRLAGSGGLFLAFGILVRMISGSFFSGVSMNYPSDFYAGISPSGFYNGGYDIMSTGSNIFSLFSGFIILVGAVMLIAGIILAVQLKKLDRS